MGAQSRDPPVAQIHQIRSIKEERHENMALGFIVPREMAMATLRWMGVPAAEARTVEGTYEDTTGVWTGNIGGIHGGRRPETGECPKPTVFQ